MDVRHLVLTNFNERDFKVTYYGLDQNPNLDMKKRPLILVFPGGSFNHLAQREGEPVALAYVDHGFNAAVVSYNLTTDPGDIYPDAGLSGLRAIQYFRQNAERLGIDPEKIITIGFSAGGHVVSVINMMAESEKWQKAFKFKHDEVAPNATILGYPLIDFTKIGFKLNSSEEKEVDDEEEKGFLNTANGVTSQTPPTFIFQAYDDPTVLIDNSLEYMMALRKHNVQFEAHIFDKGGHGFSLARPELAIKERPWIVNPHTAHWFKLSLEWLEHLKFIPSYYENEKE